MCSLLNSWCCLWLGKCKKLMPAASCDYNWPDVAIRRIVIDLLDLMWFSQAKLISAIRMSSFEFATGQWWIGGKYPAALMFSYVMIHVLMNAAENVFLTSFEKGPWNLQSMVWWIWVKSRPDFQLLHNE